MPGPFSSFVRMPPSSRNCATKVWPFLLTSPQSKRVTHFDIRANRLAVRYQLLTRPGPYSSPATSPRVALLDLLTVDIGSTIQVDQLMVVTSRDERGSNAPRPLNCSGSSHPACRRSLSPSAVNRGRLEQSSHRVGTPGPGGRWHGMAMLLHSDSKRRAAGTLAAGQDRARRFTHWYNGTIVPF